MATFFTTTFKGSNGSGRCSAADVQPGDKIISICSIGNPGHTYDNYFGLYCPYVGVIYQDIATDYSLETFLASVERP